MVSTVLSPEVAFRSVSVLFVCLFLALGVEL